MAEKSNRLPTPNYRLPTTDGDQRDEGQEDLPVASFAGLEVETYLGFISADGKSIASSIYTGAVTVL